ncbi:hypothetical protein R3X26_00620 [Vibrio sp. TH_r3]|uniref:hypothetical protein n=1 Tax=Vibrio sp. TH_r3 TaxID=3082084 RepID=UPI0029554E94|nr:hypothetical protein [Vibrio sp. TH_r3]MDV7102905.1 hypothetical protein [Vibrio sp. TH_r3]
MKKYINSHELTNETDIILARLTDFLDLPSPLTQTYEVHSDTQIAGIGDMSDNIRKGKILNSNTIKPSEYAKLNLVNIEKSKLSTIWLLIILNTFFILL